MVHERRIGASSWKNDRRTTTIKIIIQQHTMKRQSREERSVTETTFSNTESSSDYESWESCEDDSSSREDDDDGDCRAESDASMVVGPDIVPKTIPVPDRSYQVVCLSLLDEGATAPIAAKVFDESWRMLAPGGYLYVVDNRAIVSKVPQMRQMLARVIQPTPTLKSHDTRTREILEANGFDTDTGFLDSSKVVRWIATKPLT
jgi:hypothetical protein